MNDVGYRALVLGIGNVLWADEGFGVRAVEAFHDAFEVPPSVNVVEGGTQGLYLLEYVCDASHVLVFDAIDFGLEPGTLKVYRDAEVPVWADTKMSLHQASFQELLAVARLKDRFPQAITLIGAQPCVLEDFGGSLSEPIRLRVAQAVALAAAELAAWGLKVTPRARALDPQARLTASALSMSAYEDGRPSAGDACRIGDDRFMPRRPLAGDV